MPAKNKVVRVAAARAGAEKRWNPDETSAARDLAAARIEDYVQRLVAEAPPLTPEQRTRIASLVIRGGEMA